MFKFFLALGSFLSASVFATAPQMSCGNARADLKVCYVSFYTPEGESSHSLKLNYTTGESSYFAVTRKDDAQGQGISWFWGRGEVKGRAMDLWLRVDFTPTFLPVVPGNPPVAKLFYKSSANSGWQPVPGTGEFKLDSSE